MAKKLYRSVTDRKLSGVCGGIAEYFNIDASLVRFAWVIFTLFGGSGILAYIVCVIIFPDGYSCGVERPDSENPYRPDEDNRGNYN